jgi:uncharacterized membrane protein YphA (DoxX/SURF4 family)
MRAITFQKATSKTVSPTRSRVLNIALWTLQVLLAAAYVAHGWMMVSPPAELLALMNAQLGEGFRLFIGVAELLAAAGLILPGVTRILPFLTDRRGSSWLDDCDEQRHRLACGAR